MQASIDNRRNPHRRGSSSKNAEIENYLSTHYEFRYNTVLGRTEYRSRNSAYLQKSVVMKSIRSAGNLIAMKAS